MLQHLVGLSEWQICLLVIYLFVQGAFFTVFPEEVILPTLGVLWSQGRISFLEGYISAAIGLVGGDLILVMLGSHLGVRLLARRPFSWIVEAESLARALEQIRKHGPWLIFLVRFTPMVRAPMFFASGISKMPLSRFLRSDILGLVLWIPLLMVLGRRIGGSGSIEQAFHKLGILMLALLGSAILLSIYRRQRRV